MWFLVFFQTIFYLHGFQTLLSLHIWLLWYHTFLGISPSSVAPMWTFVFVLILIFFFVVLGVKPGLLVYQISTLPLSYTPSSVLSFFTNTFLLGKCSWFYDFKIKYLGNCMPHLSFQPWPLPYNPDIYQLIEHLAWILYLHLVLNISKRETFLSLYIYFIQSLAF